MRLPHASRAISFQCDQQVERQRGPREIMRRDTALTVAIVQRANGVGHRAEPVRLGHRTQRNITVARAEASPCRYPLSAVRSWLPAVGFLLLATGYWLPTHRGCRLIAVSLL